MTSHRKTSIVTTSSHPKRAHASRLRASVQSFVLLCSVAVAVACAHACASAPPLAPAPSVARADSTERVSVVREKDSTIVLVRYKIVSDTIWRDSIVERWRTKVVHDTLHTSSTDTIIQPPQIITVEKELSKGDEFFLKAGRISTIVFVGLIILLIIKIKF